MICECYCFQSVNSKPKNKSKKRNKEKTVLSLGEFVGETLENQEQQSQASGEAGDLEDFDDAIRFMLKQNVTLLKSVGRDSQQQLYFKNSNMCYRILFFHILMYLCILSLTIVSVMSY